MDDTPISKRGLAVNPPNDADALLLVNSPDLKLQCVAFGHALTLALSGNALAMFTVAHCLEKGKGVEPSKETAIFWLTRSAMVPSPPAVALYSLAARHLEGTLDHSDSAFGLKLLGRATKLGHLAARKRLMLECESETWATEARKVTFDALSDLAGVVSPNRYHVEAFLSFTRTYPASSMWDA